MTSDNLPKTPSYPKTQILCKTDKGTLYYDNQRINSTIYAIVSNLTVYDRTKTDNEKV